MAGTETYVELDEFIASTLMPRPYVDEVEASSPGWIAQRLLLVSARLDSRLAKRYAAPFRPSPYPLVVREWCVAIVTFECWLKRGIASTDQQAETYQKQYDTAFSEVEQAANSETGLYELPLRADLDGVAVTRGFPQVHSEASPYRWTVEQARRGRSEDQQS
jgi:phage gp36-like protein